MPESLLIRWRLREKQGEETSQLLPEDVEPSSTFCMLGQLYAGGAGLVYCVSCCPIPHHVLNFLVLAKTDGAVLEFSLDHDCRQMNFRFFYNELSGPKSMHNIRVWRPSLWNHIYSGKALLLFFPCAGVPVLCPSTHRMIVSTVCAGPQTSSQQLLTMKVPKQIKHRLCMDPLGGGDVFRFQAPRVWDASTKVESCWPIKQHPSDKKTCHRQPPIPVNDSIKWVPLPSFVLRREWWRLPTAHCCFVSTFLRLRSAHQSTQWQGRMCDLRAICMRSQKTMNWWPWVR